MIDVKRCAYYVDKNQIFRKEFTVPWHEDTKEYYSYNTVFRDKLGVDLCPCSDTTYYATSMNGKNLSLFSNRREHIRSVIDEQKQLGYIPGLLEYLYISTLTKDDVNFILYNKSFYNIFQNPDKQPFSEAVACATLKCLVQQNKLDYIRDKHKFLYWAYVNISIIESI